MLTTTHQHPISGSRRGRTIWYLLGLAVMAIVAAAYVSGCTKGPQVISDPASLPPDVRSWFDTYSHIDVATAATFGKYTYILAAWGPQDKSDAAVSFAKVDTSGDQVVATIHYLAGTTTASQMVYPFALMRLPATSKPVSFVSPDREYIPKTVGVPAGFRLSSTAQNGMKVVYQNPASTNILIGVSGAQPTPGSMLVEGIARVFEATLGYDILGPNGTIAGTGNTMATVAGPDWGYFKIEVPGREYITGVRVYWVSPKDGTKMDIVTVTWGG